MTHKRKVSAVVESVNDVREETNIRFLSLEELEQKKQLGLIDDGENKLINDSSLRISDNDTGYNSMDDTKGEDQEAFTTQIEPFVPIYHNLESDEELVMDSSAYETYLKFTSHLSMLSFDIPRNTNQLIQRDLCINETFLVAGTQAPESTPELNSLCLFHFSDLNPLQDSDSNNSESESEEKDYEINNHSHNNAKINCCQTSTGGTAINKLSICKQYSRLVATMNSNSSLTVYDINDLCTNLIDKSSVSNNQVIQHNVAPVFNYMLPSEGFALTWSNSSPSFATGCLDGFSALYEPIESGWKLSRQFNYHSASVDAVSFHYHNSNILALGSQDGTISIWDLRQESPVNIIKGHHTGDINCVNFRPSENLDHLLSTCQDGTVIITDITVPDLPLAKFSYHRNPVFTADWCPHDPSMFCCGGFDDSVTIWDLSIEPESYDSVDSALHNYPSQLLFEHLGNNNLSEVKFLPNNPYMCINSDVDGFTIWRAANLLETTS